MYFLLKLTLPPNRLIPLLKGLVHLVLLNQVDLARQDCPHREDPHNSNHLLQGPLASDHQEVLDPPASDHQVVQNPPVSDHQVGLNPLVSDHQEVPNPPVSNHQVVFQERELDPKPLLPHYLNQLRPVNQLHRVNQARLVNQVQ